MAVRSTMSALIARTRLLINDTAGASQIFANQDIQDVLDESRVDIYNQALTAKLTYSGNTPLYLDYLSQCGGWEDDFVLKQYLITVVTPAASEPIAGYFHFTATTYPPVYITGKLYDVYRGSADLLERWAAKLVLQFDFSSDGQSFHRSQAAAMLQKLACTYRYKQRAYSIEMVRNDLAGDRAVALTLGAKPLDYFAKG